MATIGQRAYPQAAHTFIDALVRGDAGEACSVLAVDADLRSPWNDHILTGRDKIQEVLGAMLADPKTRPSFSLLDVTGDGNVVTMTVSESGRFGAAGRRRKIQALHLKGELHHVTIE